MCWCAYRIKDLQCRKAKSDIVCYKIIQDDLKSQIKLFQYKLDKIYKLDHPLYLDKEKICQGFHSYKDCPSEYFIFKYLNFLSLIIVQCIIPKGSHYFINDHGEMVSDSIKIVKRIR